MYEICRLKNKKCTYAAISKNVEYCGLAYGKNKITELKKCPKKELKQY